MAEPSAFNVSLSDLYHELVALRQDVSVALAKMERTNERANAADQRVADHETRLRDLESAVPSSLEVRIMSLEKFRWQVLGALVVINALGVAIEWFILPIKK